MGEHRGRSSPPARSGRTLTLCLASGVLAAGALTGLVACAGSTEPSRAGLTLAGPTSEATGATSDTDTDTGTGTTTGAEGEHQVTAPRSTSALSTSSTSQLAVSSSATSSGPGAGGLTAPSTTATPDRPTTLRETSPPSAPSAGGAAAAPTTPTSTMATGTATSGASGGAQSALRSLATATTTAGALLTLGPGTPSAPEAEVIRLVNVERTAVGCAALTVSPVLVQVARAHSQEMTLPGGFRHNSPDGRTPFQRLTAVGYNYSIATENIAAGQPNAAAVMSAWMTSSEHKANMLDCRLTQIGVGVVNRPGSQYGTYWTQDIATPM